MKSRQKAGVYNVHKTFGINLNGTVVEVDEELVNLILELGRLGLRPVNCCQGGTPRGCERTYISLILDEDSYFEYDTDSRMLTVRWNRCGKKLKPATSYILKGKRTILIKGIKKKKTRGK